MTVSHDTTKARGIENDPEPKSRFSFSILWVSNNFIIERQYLKEFWEEGIIKKKQQ